MGKKLEDADDSPAKMENNSKKKKTSTNTNDLLDVGDNHIEINGDPEEKGCKHREKKRKLETNEDEDEYPHDKGNLVNDGDLQKKRKRYSFEQAQITENRQDQDDEGAVEKDCDPNLEEKEMGDLDGAEIVTFDKVDKKTQKKKKKTFNQNLETKMNEIMSADSTLKTHVTKDGKDLKGIKKNNSVEAKSEKQKVKVNGIILKEKTTESVKNNNEKAKGKSKKVTFSGRVEVFPSSDTEPEKQTTQGDASRKKKTKIDGIVQGKRFKPEEDEIIKEAVFNYIAVHNLGDDGLEKVLNCKSYPGLKKCWQDIATCIPYRPYVSVYNRGHILFERSKTCGWTPEEIERLKELHKKYGNQWKKLSKELGKHRSHVKDVWRRIKLENKKAGRWSQEEYQSLYDLVNLDLQVKINGEKKSKHGMLRDNIPWTAISEKLSTRSDSSCCIKWYDQLTSSLVAENKWRDTDDYRLIGELYELDAACVEDVDWDNLLEHRPGDVCRKRWDQMVKHIGHQGSKPFAEQVDTLAKRYCPDLAETREAWDNKPCVP